MANIPGTNVASIIVPNTTDDDYATHDALYGKGGYRSVATIADRDAITAKRKDKGMIVNVQANNLNYQWNGTAWVEWLPKGNVTVDQSLNKASTNAVSNKVVTTAINNLSQELNITKETANAALPITQVLATMPTTPDDTTVNTVSTKGIKTYVDDANSAQDTKIAANTTAAANAKSAADKAQIAANAAKLAADASFKSVNIDKSTGTTPVTTPADDHVPSTKYFHTVLTSEKTTLNASIAAAKKEGTEAKTAASNAQTTANNAIPKAKIATGFDSTTTADHTYVPSAKLANEYFNNIDGQINELRTDVDNKIPFNDKTNTITNSESVKVATEKAVKNYVDTQIKTATDASTAVGTRVTALETWKKDVGPRNDANGYAGLDANSKIPASLLPAGYDNVDMLVNFVSTAPTSGMTAGQKWYITGTKKIFTATSATTGTSTNPEDEKIYINIATNKSYRWAGTSSGMVVVGNGSGVALGTTSSTAFRGDYGNALYTEFGSGKNLTDMKAARDFFGNITPATDQFIEKFLSFVQGAEKATLTYAYKSFTGEVNSANLFINAATDEKSGLMTAAMFKTLQEIELATFPLSLTLGGAGTFEKGASATNAVTISAVRKGTNVTASSTVTVTPPSGVTGTLASNKASWTPSAAIKSNATISVKVTYGSQTQTKTISYTFKSKKYWGVSAKTTLTNAEMIALASGWADSGVKPAATFDCTGGKYPYYIVPTSMANIEWWIGGLKNTNITSTVVQLTNASGATESYTVMRLNDIQTGKLSIEFKLPG